jgi:hypothetical protein
LKRYLIIKVIIYWDQGNWRSRDETVNPSVVVTSADHSNQEHHNSEDSYNLIQEIMKRHNEEKNKKIDNLDEHLMI